MVFPTDSVRRQFPLISSGDARGEPIAYFDLAGTAQKPEAVLHAIREFYETANANIHRGVHSLGNEATERYERARAIVQRFIHAAHADEIVFTKGTTESINLVAHSLGKTWNQGDAIVLTALEHHSNMIPWMMLRDERGVELRWVDCDANGTLDMRQFESHLSDGRVKLAAVTGQSNVLGVRPDIRKMTGLARAAGALILVDGAQLIAHAAIDVAAIDCDFLAFSGHKLYGPTGIGVLYGKRQLLRDMPPFLGGGSMVQNVTRDGFTVADAPQKFEAGTQPIAEAVGLSAAIEWLDQYSWDDRAAHERAMLDVILKILRETPDVQILGPGNSDAVSGCVSFVMKGVHAHDVAEILSSDRVFVRAGHHCAQPLHDALRVTASVRISVGIFNTEADAAMLRAGLAHVRSVLLS